MSTIMWYESDLHNMSRVEQELAYISEQPRGTKFLSSGYRNGYEAFGRVLARRLARDGFQVRREDEVLQAYAR